VVIGPGGKDSLTIPNYIVITAVIPKPSPKFSGAPTSGKDSLKVQFTDSSTGTITSRLWNFGDNTTDTSASPLHNYTKPGSFPVKLVVIGPGGKDSLTVPNYIVITATADTNRPINPIILTATAQSDSSILLFWNKTSGFDSLRIWKGSFAIPPLTVAPGNGYETIAIGLTDTTKLLTGLSPVTSYFFGAQVFGNGLWSIITDKSTASAKTLETADTATVVNTIQITKILFDGLTNSIKVFWTKDSAQSLNYTIGISFSAAGYPADTNAPKRIVPGNLPTDSATIALGASILFDTVYYGALWLKKGAGPWSTPITTSIAVPSFTWQEIVYFKANGARDTSYAFNKRIRLSNDVAGDPIKDTLIAWFPLDAVTNGFIPVSVGFYFKRKNPSPSFFIGLRCDSIPKRYSADSVRIYRYDNGAWLVEANSACDPVTDFVSVKTRDLEKPFIAMIDTVRPAYTHLGTLEPIIAGRPIADTFVVNDNVSNMRCSFRYAKGANSYAEGDSNDTVLTLKMDTVVNTIQGSTVSEDNGVRALFIISDGVHTDTMNISRQTIRTQRSDAFMAGAMQWMPLHATALPETSDIRHALRNFSVKGAWSYDPSAFRLFRWYPSAQNAQTTDKYIEYSDSIRNIFSISPGNILWLKSRKQVQVDFGSATTPLLTAPYGIITQPGEWTDIALPFKFDIFIGDVLASTRGAGQAADSLEWYRWTLDTKSHYFADPVYVPGLGDAAPQLTDESYEIVSKETVGYTVRNTSHESTKILFPPLPPSMSSFAKPLVKKSIRGNWALTIRGRVAGGETLSRTAKKPLFFQRPSVNGRGRHSSMRQPPKPFRPPTGVRRIRRNSGDLQFSLYQLFRGLGNHRIFH
jgi:PKD repeat protein